MTTSDCIIVGGGIVGMLSARELALHGFEASLIDSQVPGKQCSWAGGGILSALYPWQLEEELQELCTLSQKLYPILAENLLRATGIDPELWQCGMLIHANEPAPALQWAERKNITHEVLGHDRAALMVPALNQQPASWLWFPELAQVRNPRLLSALKINLRQLGVKVYEHTEVTRIIIRQEQAQGVETARGTFNTPITVIACGAWTSRLWPGITVKPVRGQMLCYLAERDFLQTMVLKYGKYAIPRRDGHILVGSTVEDAGFDMGTSAEARTALAAAAEDMLPGINQYPLTGHWSGLRPATPGGLPCIGPWPGAEGLYLNTGHFRNGVVLAPGSARLLADLILQRTPAVSPEAFLPAAAGYSG
ncbi:MAG: glycine oxidase ThiO [Gammaproteobacteria bacterium]